MVVTAVPWTSYLMYAAVALACPVVLYLVLAVLYGAFVLSCLVVLSLLGFGRDKPTKLDESERRKLEEMCPRSGVAELSEVERASTCSICLGLLADRPHGEQESLEAGDLLDDPLPLRRLRCGHVFHAACVDVWLDRGMPCALCRAPPLGDPAAREMLQRPPAMGQMAEPLFPR